MQCSWAQTCRTSSWERVGYLQGDCSPSICNATAPSCFYCTSSQVKSMCAEEPVEVLFYMWSSRPFACWSSSCSKRRRLQLQGHNPRTVWVSVTLVLTVVEWWCHWNVLRSSEADRPPFKEQKPRESDVQFSAATSWTFHSLKWPLFTFLNVF